MKRLLSVFLYIVICFPAFAQDKETKEQKRLSIFPFPLISYSPETNFLFGAAGSFTFRFKKDPLSVRPSNVFVGGAYTLNKQILLYTQFKVFYDTNKYYFFGEAGYYKYNYYYYGMGETVVPEELYGVDFPRVIITGTRKVLPHLYIGPRYHYEQFQLYDIDTGGALFDGTVPGSNGSIVSGAGMGVIYDTRDSVFYPREGFYNEVTYTNYGRTWGGNFNYNRIIVDIAHYDELWNNVILASNSYNSFVLGNAPFQQLSLLGGTKKMRGLYEGRFRDKNLMMLQAEVRFPIFWRFGGVVFGDVGAIGNQNDFIRFNDPKYTFGAGLRFVIARKDHLNIRIDYGIGPGTSGAYITIGEAF